MKKKIISVVFCLLSTSIILTGQINNDELIVVPKTPEAALFDQYINTAYSGDADPLSG